MKFTDIYFDYKNRYPDYLIFYRTGNFYTILGNDCILINQIFSYKILENNGLLRIGFPVASLQKIINVIHDKKINYILIEKEEGIVKIKYRKKYKENNYPTLDVPEIYKTRNQRIFKIYNYLKEHIFDNNMDTILQQIEDIYER